MTEADLERLNGLLGRGMARHLAIAVVEGQTEVAVAWAEHAVSQRGYELLGQSPAAWPSPALVWDLAPANWHRAMDGLAAAAVAADYPDVALFEVDRDELEAALAPAARRLEDPFSETYRSKTALLVAHLESGAWVTPPFVVGYHRFGWACFLSLATIPILARSGEQALLATTAPSLREVAV
jgi:hypothetical protein